MHLSYYFQIETRFFSYIFKKNRDRMRAATIYIKGRICLWGYLPPLFIREKIVFAEHFLDGLQRAGHLLFGVCGH